MYALVNGNELLLGPIPFNIGMINSELEDLGIDYKIVSSNKDEVPLSITDEVRLLTAIEEIPTIDARFEQVFQKSHKILRDKVIFQYEKVNKSLAQVKQERKAIISTERKKLENTLIDIPINGVNITVSTSKASRVSYLSKLLSSSSSGYYNFKFENDVWVEITASDLSYIIQRIDQKVQGAFDWEISKKRLIDQCETVNEVYDIEVIIPNVG